MPINAKSVELYNAGKKHVIDLCVGMEELVNEYVRMLEKRRFSHCPDNEPVGYLCYKRIIKTAVKSLEIEVFIFYKPPIWGMLRIFFPEINKKQILELQTPREMGEQLDALLD